MIKTERCIIRCFKKKDIEDFMTYRNDLEWMKYQGFKGLTRDAYQEVLFCDPTPEEGLQLAVASRQSDGLIGDLYLRRQADSFWIGYTVHPAYAGQGLMREAVASFVSVLLQCPGCNEIFAGTLKENIRSKNLLGKIGFRLAYYDEGTQEDVYRIHKVDA